MKNIDLVVNSAFKDIKKNLTENVLDYPRNALASDVWDKNGEILPTVKNEIMKRFNSWKKEYAPDMKVLDAYILGSITTYQFNKTSDIDVNFIVNWEKSKIDKVWKMLPNNNTLQGTKHPINLYVSANKNDVNKSKTLYDLQNEKWERKPDKDDVAIPQKYSLEIARLFMDGIDSRINELERDRKELEQLEELLDSDNSYVDKKELEEEVERKKDEISADIDAIRLALYIVTGFRKEGFSDQEWKFKFNINVTTNDDPNKTLNNLIYKELEKFGYLEKIKKITKEK